jgi:hypothetical protein
VQFGLRLDGSKVTLDGIFGPLTKQAVEGEQLALGLQVDGIVGPKTGGALWHDIVMDAHGILGPTGISNCYLLLPTIT